MDVLPAAPPLIRLDARGGVSLQQQVYAGIRRAILDGVLGPGARLLSSRALAMDLGVSRTTTLVALEQLTAEGYLTARRGSGTFVADELPDMLPQPRPARSAAAGGAAPGLSRRGAALARMPPPGLRTGGPPRAFRIGTPGLDLFPWRLWWRLAHRRQRSLSPARLDYGDPAGLRALRQAIAEHVSLSRGTRCDADQVLIVAGAQRGVDLVCHLLLDPDDLVWIEEPGYPGARSALVAAGARPCPVRVDADGLDVEAGLRRAAGARMAYVTPSHQFPLGVPMSLPRRLALLEWARAAGAWIVEDDYDSEFRYGAHPVPCLHGLDPDGRVLYVGSFSKSVFPTLRLGFLIAPPNLYDKLVAARNAADVHPPGLDQAVLADFIGEGHFERHLRRMRAAYRERLEAFGAAARRLCGGALQLHDVRSGLHAVGDLHGVDASRVFGQAAARGVEVMPLAAYYVHRARAANGLVFGFAAVPPAAACRGMERLAAAIEAAAAG